MDETDAQSPLDLSPPSEPPPRQGRKRSVAITGLFVLAVCYTLYVAQDILMPITAAVILAVLLQPAVRLFGRVRIPEPIAAGIVVAAFFAGLAVGIYFLSDPAARWIAEMPGLVAEVQEKIRAPIQEIKDAKEVVEDIVEETEMDTDAPPNGEEANGAPPLAAPPPAETPPDETAPSAPPPAKESRVSLIEVMTQTFVVLSDVAWGALIVFVLLYFLLATGSTLRENIVLALPTIRDKKKALTVTRDVQRGVSVYLATVILINLGLGVAIGFAMYGLGLPNPALWGAMAAMFNFIPYLGAIAGSVVVTIVGLVTYVTPIEALLPPIVYIAINSLEGYLVTPAILSRRLTINPIAVFLSVIFWGWIWGVAGALMAVPILACLKVVCDSSARLAPVSQFLGGRRSD